MHRRGISYRYDIKSWGLYRLSGHRPFSVMPIALCNNCFEGVMELWREGATFACVLRESLAISLAVIQVFVVTAITTLPQTRAIGFVVQIIFIQIYAMLFLSWDNRKCLCWSWWF